MEFWSLYFLCKGRHGYDTLTYVGDFMVKSILIGFFLGLGVSIINHQLILRASNNIVENSLGKKKITSRFIIRYLLNFLLLFMVHKNTPMLISAALGLTMVKNYMLIQYTLGKGN